MAKSLGSMLTRAFKWHWNLLVLGAGAAFSLLSGNPEVLAGVAAVEIAYLGFLGTNPRFQNVLQGEQLTKDQALSRGQQQAKLQEIMHLLSDDDATRFLKLRVRCTELLSLRQTLDGAAGSTGMNNFRTESLDKMLWLFLKLLHQKAGIERFMSTTRRGQIEFEKTETESQLARIRDHSPERLVKSIEEKLATMNDRLANFDRAQESLDLTLAELDKTEQKINHVCETGLTGMDSDDLSIQIDSISDTLRTSDQQLVPPGLRSILDDEAPPSFLSTAAAMQAE